MSVRHQLCSKYYTTATSADYRCTEGVELMRIRRRPGSVAFPPEPSMTIDELSSPTHPRTPLGFAYLTHDFAPTDRDHRRGGLPSCAGTQLGAGSGAGDRRGRPKAPGRAA